MTDAISKQSFIESVRRSFMSLDGGRFSIIIKALFTIQSMSPKKSIAYSETNADKEAAKMRERIMRKRIKEQKKKK